MIVGRIILPFFVIAMIYFAHQISYFLYSTFLLIRWIVDRDNQIKKCEIFDNYWFYILLLVFSMELMYGYGDVGFLSILILVILEFFWKLFTLMMIFRTIQYIRREKPSFDDDVLRTKQLIV